MDKRPLSALLQRLETSDEGTFGRLLFGGETLFTGELPWRDNASDISCIPAGKYLCLWTMSARFKRPMYLVDNVADRVGVRIHSANFMGDKAKGCKCQLNGCVSLGLKLGWMSGQKALVSSVAAVLLFENAMGRLPFDLEIVDEYV